MSIKSLLKADCVVCNVEARSKKHTLEILSELLCRGENDILAGEVFDSLIQRERLGSTGLGDGIAIPHGRCAALTDSVGAFLKLSDPVSFDAPDNEPVDLVFAILVPEAAGEEHLATLSMIARGFREAEYVADLRAQSSSRALYEKLIDGLSPAPAVNGTAHAAGGNGAVEPNGAAADPPPAPAEDAVDEPPRLEGGASEAPAG